MATKPSTGFLAYTAIALVVALVYAGADAVQTSLQGLPVTDIGKAKVSAQDFNKESIYPVWIGQLQKAAPEGGSIDLDSAFAKPASEGEKGGAGKHEPEQLIDASADLAHALEKQLTLDGVTSNGAVISGRFFAKGESMTQYGAANLSGTVVFPQLAAVTPTTATLVVGGHTLTLRSSRGTP